MGGYCIIEGTDKYCKDGLTITDAINKSNKSNFKFK